MLVHLTKQAAPQVEGSAFTRADLLVILATVALVSVLVGLVGSSSRRKSRLQVCTANLQQISRALLLYSEQNQGKVPDASASSQGDIWWWYKEKVKGFIGLSGLSSTNDKVFACPDDRGYSDPYPFHITPRFDFSSYVFNGVTLPGMPNIAGRQISGLRSPAQTLLVMEWVTHAPLSWHRSRTGRENVPFYTDAESVVGFSDGHVSFSKIYYDGYNAAYTRDPIAGYGYKFTGD